MNKEERIKKLKIDIAKFEGIIFNIEMQDRLTSEDWEYISKYKRIIKEKQEKIKKIEKEN